MKLEEEIKQKEFTNVYNKLAVNIIYTNSWLDYHLQKRFKEHDLTSSQYNILRILKGQYPDKVSVNLLKDRMLDKMSDASRLVERLRVKGFVERETSKIDRRKVEVIITEAGLNLLKDLDVLENDIDKLLESLTEEEAETINNLLDKARNSN